MEEINIISEVVDTSIENKKAVIHSLISPKSKEKYHDEAILESLKIDTFYRLIERDIGEQAELVVSPIIEVALKQLILLEYDAKKLNRTIIPHIILPSVKKGGNEVGAKELASKGKTSSKKGGLIKKFIPKARIIAQTQSSVGKISFNKRINAYFSGKSPTESYVVPKDTMVEIVGLFIRSVVPANSRCIENKLKHISLFDDPYLAIKSGSEQLILSLLRRVIDWKQYMKTDYRLCIQASEAYHNKTTLPQDHPLSLIDVKSDPISLDLERTGWFKLATNGRRILAADLFAMGMDKLYYNYDKQKIEDLVAMRERRQKQIKAQLELLSEQNKIKMYKDLIQKKLKKEIKTNYTKVADLLSALNDKERALIKSEQEKEENYQKGILTNKCPHVAIQRELREDVAFGKQKTILSELKTYFAKSADDKTIMCSRCHFPIMCAHEVAIIENRLNNATIDQMRLNMTKFFTKVDLHYQCQICFEYIPEIEDMEVEVPHAPDTVDEQIVEKIMGEIYRLRRFINIGKVPMKKIANIIYLSSYDAIVQVNHSLKRNRILSEKEYHRRLALYIDIYIFAYFIKLSEQGYLTIVKSEKKPRKGAKPEKRDVIQQSVDFINDYANIIIRESIDINASWIKHKMAEIIKTTSLSQSNLASEATLSDDIIAKSDMVVQYWRALSALIGQKHSIAPESAYVPLSLKINTSPFFLLRNEYKTEPKLITQNSTDKYPYGGLSIMVRNPTKDEVIGYFAASAALFYKSLRYQGVNFSLKEVKNDLIPEFSAEYESIRSDSNTISICEQVLMRYRDSLNIKVLFHRLIQVKRPKPKSPLGRIYDAEGRAHQFKYNMEKRDYFCDICQSWRSDSIKIADTVISKAVAEKNRKACFYKMFELNCPKGGVHDFGGEICAKCKIKKEMKPADPQYDEYYAEHQNEFSKLSKVEREIHLPKASTIEHKSQLDPEMYKSWIFDFKKIVAFASKIEINPKLLMALGDYDGNNYEKIISGEYVPAVVDVKNSTRSLVLKSYIKLLITTYNQLRFSYTGRPRYEITALIERAQVAHDVQAKLGDLLPSIYDNQYDKIMLFEDNKSPELIVEFLIEMLCDILMKILTAESPETAALRQEFVRSFVEKMLRGSYLRTNYTYFNFALIYGEKGTKSSDSTYTSDEYATPLDENEDEEAVPMSLDGFDMEDGDADDEDPQTLIRTSID